MSEAAHTDAYTPRRLMMRLIREYVRPQKGRLLAAIACMVVVAAATAANAWMMKPVLDEIFIEKDANMLHILPFAIFALALVSGAANYGQTFFMRYIGQRIIGDMQLNLFRHLLASDLSLYHDQAAGRLISRFTNDIQLMRGAVSTVLTSVAKQFLTLVFLLIVMMVQSWQMTLLAFGLYPLAILPLMRWARKMRRLSHKSQEQLGEFSARLDEVFSGIRTVKAYGREGYEAERARGVIERLFKSYYRAARAGAAASPLMEALGGIAIASVIWYGGARVLDGSMTVGAFTSFIASLILAYKPAKSMTGIGTVLQEGLAAASRLFEVLDTKPMIADAPDATPLTLAQGRIAFEDVTFRYTPEGSGVEHITLDVPGGKTVALVGLSGGGKSTLMSLLLRFYDPQGGQIRIDGQDIRHVTLESLRAQTAFVPQDIMLFDDTVAANIAYGRAGATEEDIIQAATQAAAHEFIARLPQGYQTLIGPHGLKLSGGQRQRLAIARAMLKNAPILLLDEATSALDNESERIVQQALSRLMAGRTTLVIAHRLSTIRHADLIYVIERGRVAESGTHDSLLAARGAYWRLYADHRFQEA